MPLKLFFGSFTILCNFNTSCSYACIDLISSSLNKDTSCLEKNPLTPFTNPEEAGLVIALVIVLNIVLCYNIFVDNIFLKDIKDVMK